MARKIIVLDRTNRSPALVGYRYALWADVPAARQKFCVDAAKTLRVLDPTAQELADFRAGKFLEKIEEQQWRIGTPVADILASLVAAFGAWQQYVNTDNPWDRYGSYWDGTSWTAVTTT